MLNDKQTMTTELKPSQKFMLAYHAECMASLTQKSTAKLIEELYPHLFEIAQKEIKGY